MADNFKCISLKENRLDAGTQMWPSIVIKVMTLTLKLQGQIWNLLYRISWKLGRHHRHIYPWSFYVMNEGSDNASLKQMDHVGRMKTV